MWRIGINVRLRSVSGRGSGNPRRRLGTHPQADATDTLDLNGHAAGGVADIHRLFDEEVKWEKQG
jgi:hypothetical protein